MTDVAAMLRRLGLSLELEPPLTRLAALLSSDPLAPISVRARGEAIEAHLADSLSATTLAPVRDAVTIVDIGAGAGLPGLPLALALPASHVWLVESNGRKCDFIARAAAECAAGNATVVNARAEAWPAGRERADAVTARALAPLDVVAEYAAPLLKLGGVLVAWRGRREPAGEAAAARAAARLGLVLEEPLATALFSGAEHRHLHVLHKVAPTPAGYPRRVGVARKRPLGAAPRTV